MIDTVALKQLAINKFKLDINSVIDGLADIAVSNLLSAGDIDTYLKGLGEEFGDMETNGWQYDFWQNYKINNKYYCLSGSGYYGGIKFYERNEEEILDSLADEADKYLERLDPERLNKLMEKAQSLLGDGLDEEEIEYKSDIDPKEVSRLLKKTEKLFKKRGIR